MKKILKIAKWCVGFAKHIIVLSLQILHSFFLLRLFLSDPLVPWRPGQSKICWSFSDQGLIDNSTYVAININNYIIMKT